MFIKQKRFIGEVTKEVLIVTEDGCYTSKTDQTTGVIFMQKLGDIREVLENPPIINYKPTSSPALVKPG